MLGLRQLHIIVTLEDEIDRQDIGSSKDSMSQTKPFPSYNYQPSSRKPFTTHAFNEDAKQCDGDQPSAALPIAGHSLLSKAETANYPHSTRSVFAVWWLEILCCFLTTAMFIALVYILLPYHGQTPLPELPYHISINTVLAIVVTTLKTCGLVAVAEGLSQLKWEHFKRPTELHHLVSYDTASRGPWGCAKLIIALRWHHLLGSLGAIVMILFIAVDPFTQQLVKYSPCNIPAANGSIAYMARTSAYWENLPAKVTELYELNLDQSNAILAGFFGPDEVKIPAQCPSGNCTYDNPYATLAFCANCDDVTSELTYSYTNKSAHEQDIFRKGQVLTFYNTSLSSGVSTATVRNDPQHSTLFNIRAVYDPTLFEAYSTETTIEIILGKWDPAQKIGSYADLWGGPPGDNCRDTWQNETWGCRGQGAARCTIKPCVQLLKGWVRSGVPSEDIVDTYTDWYYGLPDDKITKFAMADLSCVNDSAKTQLEALGHNISTSRFIPYNVVAWSDNDFQQLSSGHSNLTDTEILTDGQKSLVPKECIYQMSGTTTAALGHFLNDTFSQQVGISPSYLQLTGQIQGLRILNNTYTNAEYVGKLFDAMARSLSMLARQTVYNNTPSFNTPAQGVILVGETCVDVRWPWIIYPATLTVLTVGFLIAVISRTEISDTDGLARGWKSSLLPLVYHEIDGTGQGSEKALRYQLSDIKLLEKAAEKDIGCIAPIPGSDRSVKLPPSECSSLYER